MDCSRILTSLLHVILLNKPVSGRHSGKYHNFNYKFCWVPGCWSVSWAITSSLTEGTLILPFLFLPGPVSFATFVPVPDVLLTHRPGTHAQSKYLAPIALFQRQLTTTSATSSSVAALETVPLRLHGQVEVMQCTCYCCRFTSMDILSLEDIAFCGVAAVRLCLSSLNFGGRCTSHCCKLQCLYLFCALLPGLLVCMFCLLKKNCICVFHFLCVCVVIVLKEDCNLLSNLAVGLALLCLSVWLLCVVPSLIDCPTFYLLLFRNIPDGHCKVRTTSCGMISTSVWSLLLLHFVYDANSCHYCICLPFSLTMPSVLFQCSAILHFVWRLTACTCLFAC